jgi:hypothetical protein
MLGVVTQSPSCLSPPLHSFLFSFDFSITSILSSSLDILSSILFSLLERLSTELFYLRSFSYPELQFNFLGFLYLY